MKLLRVDALSAPVKRIWTGSTSVQRHFSVTEDHDRTVDEINISPLLRGRKGPLTCIYFPVESHCFVLLIWPYCFVPRDIFCLAGVVSLVLTFKILSLFPLVQPGHSYLLTDASKLISSSSLIWRRWRLGLRCSLFRLSRPLIGPLSLVPANSVC